jgi:hypothetical protein
MEDKSAAQWAFIFDQLGQEQLRKMLFKAAMEKDEDGRVVVEFEGTRALNVTEHYKEMEANLENQVTK